MKHQHLTSVEAIAALSEAEVEGLDLGSTSLTFRPKKRLAGSFRFDIGTAGSVSLILQTLMPAAAFARGKVVLTVTGGTDVAWSPTIDYLRFVTLPILEKMGYGASIRLERRGHYPKGGGRVVAEISNVKQLQPLNAVKLGTVSRITGLSHCVKLPPHVAERQARSAKEWLLVAGACDAEIELEHYPRERDPHIAPGSGMVLVAHSDSGAVLGADALGMIGRPAEKVGEEAAKRLLKELQPGYAFDSHMADILVPYLAIANGTSEVGVSRLTLHAVTNIHVTDTILGVKFQVAGELDQPAVIRVKGVGLTS